VGETVNLSGTSGVTTGSGADAGTCTLARGLTVSWRFDAFPPGSSPVLEGAASPVATFVPDRPGVYQLTETIQNSSGMSASAQFTVTAGVPSTPLLAVVKGAVLLADGWTVALLTQSPDGVLLLDAQDESTFRIPLPATPSSMAVWPGTSHLVVGLDGAVADVDTQSRTLVRTLTVAAPVGDLAVNAAGLAVVMPSRDQWTDLHTVDLVSGVTRVHSMSGVHAGGSMAMHPSGTRFYYVDRGLSPTDVHRVDINAAGDLSQARDSPYHGDHPMGPGILVFDDGLRLVAGGTALALTTTVEADLVYAGSLMPRGRTVGRVAADHELLAAGSGDDEPWFSTDDSVLSVHEDTLFSQRAEYVLPRPPGSDGSPDTTLVAACFIPARNAYFVVVAPTNFSGQAAGLAGYGFIPRTHL
jgi:hypothetical protein